MNTHTIMLTEAELQTVAAALGEIPYKMAASVIASIGKQVAAAAEARARMDGKVENLRSVPPAERMAQ